MQSLVPAIYDSFVRSFRSLAIYCCFQFRKLGESDVIKEIECVACGKSVGYCSVWDKSIKTGGENRHQALAWFVECEDQCTLPRTWMWPECQYETLDRISRGNYYCVNLKLPTIFSISFGRLIAEPLLDYVMESCLTYSDFVYTGTPQLFSLVNGLCQLKKHISNSKSNILIASHTATKHKKQVWFKIQWIHIEKKFICQIQYDLSIHQNNYEMY